MNPINSSQLSLKSIDSDISETSQRSGTIDDWENREFIEMTTTGLQRITQFLNCFDKSCKVKLAALNQKVTNLEKTMDYLETYFSGITDNQTIEKPEPKNIDTQQPNIDNQDSNIDFKELFENIEN